MAREKKDVIGSEINDEMTYIQCLNLNETRNSIKKWPLNLWWISNKTIMEVGNITKAVFFKTFLHLSY